jgi:hypothetical protein
MYKNMNEVFITENSDVNNLTVKHPHFIMVSTDLLNQIAKEEIWLEFKKDPVGWVDKNASYYSSEQR